jgi:hypothetical protein
LSYNLTDPWWQEISKFCSHKNQKLLTIYCYLLQTS